nr:RNA-directed DNA polymerase, eukaryota [Tanacetum cinerariifolium]
MVDFEDIPNRDGGSVERNSEGERPSGLRADNNGSQEMNLPLLLAAHIGRSENDQPLQSSLTSVHGGPQSLINRGGNLPPNGLCKGKWKHVIYLLVMSESSDDEEGTEDDGLQSGDKVTSDNDVERVSELSCMHNNDLLYDNNHNNIMPDKDKVLFGEPFNLYDILNKRKDSSDDLKYPPGCTPSMINVEEVNKKVKGATGHEIYEHANSTSNKLEESVLKRKLLSNNSICSKRVHTSGLILQLIDELVKVGQTMGYNMEGCLRNIEVIVSSQGECSETKIKSMDFVTIKTLWGNYSFDYALSSSLGNSGEDTWKSLPTVDSDSMINLRKKLQALKIGGSNKVILADRSLLLKELNDINSIDSLEAGQKSKLAIRGTLVDGEWIVDSLAVKSVFLKYFSTQFSSPVSSRICFANQYTNRLSLEQQADLKRNVANDEIKSAVWDAGRNKSLGPNGFTF